MVNYVSAYSLLYFDLRHVFRLHQERACNMKKMMMLYMNFNLRITIFTAIAMFLSMLDTGIVSISIKHISEALPGETALSPIILTSYSLFLCGTILIFGQLSAMYGSLLVFRIGLITFLGTSILCALAWSMWSLIGFRCLQGISAAMLQATSLALISLYVAEENKTKTMATVISLAGIGPVVAPALGGFIIEHMTWEWMFYLNIPFCMMALWLSSNIEAKKTLHSPQKFSHIVSYTTCILLFFTGIFLSKEIVFFTLSAISLLISLYLDNKNHLHGILVNQHIMDGRFYASLLLFTTLGLTTSCMFIIPPIKLLMTYDVLTVSLTTMLLPICTVITAKLSAHVIMKWGHEVVCIIGILLMGMGTIGVFNAHFTYHLAVFCLLTFGMGCGLFQPSNTILLFNAAQKNYHPMSNALSRLCVNLGIALGSAIISLCYIEKIV